MDWLIAPQVTDIRENTLCVYMALRFYAVIMVGRVHSGNIKGIFPDDRGMEVGR
jgi:hypothetical protein